MVVVFALGVLGLARFEGARADGGGGTSALGIAQAGLCFLACTAVVAYGIYLIVPQFH
ncbi:hypothetical protein RKD25_002871 [Streptomyces sp. SAI-124]